MLVLRETVVLFLVIMSITICDISYDMYAPGLPQIGAFFGVAQTIVQLTVSMNLLGGALSGLIYGPLSDHYGRRSVMLWGIAIFVIASIGCCFAWSIGVLIVLRFLQGLGAGVAGVVGFAIVNDMYVGEAAAKNLSIVNMVVSLSPAVGPIMGSYIVSLGYGWRLLFVLVSMISVLLLLALIFGLTETIQNRREKLSLSSILAEYGALFRNYRFLCFALVQSLTIMWVWASMANLPFVFIEGMHLPVEYYGYLVAMSVVSYIAGTIVNRRLIGKLGMMRMIVLGLLSVMIPDVIVIICHYAFPAFLTPLFIEMIWLPSSFGIAFITSNSVAIAFGEVKDKGAASAFISFGQTIFGACGIYIVGKFYNGTIVPVSVLPIVCCLLGMSIIWLLTKREGMFPREKTV
ncbi:drug resistance transporter, Bcr/CflA subfamily protein [Anaplasma phagocytophilum str. ApMUC09]|uniref:Bcr/CflA family efflux transporter n=1 Tax=Anaplasma phagocytophilum str. ApMUC09 TaxID=1359152 RepID=A0A0F3N8K5_ANAPH|nr:drug resistance transporter, Bcr/CflA subfamily protein [Anaplasma phagocytophilum str. ApMUC09]SCV63946.1 Bicyclomycin resistance protein [Anaplasma phagocytophilum]